MKIEGFPKEPEQGVHVAKEVEEEKDVVGGVGAERGHAHREEGHVVEGHQADHDQFERVVVPFGCNSIADRGQDLDVALPDNGQGKGEHPLDIERDDKEEHREDPVLDAYDQDVKLGHVVPSEPSTEVIIFPPCQRQLEMGDNDHGNDPGTSADDPDQRHGLRETQKWTPCKGAEGPVRKEDQIMISVDIFKVTIHPSFRQNQQW